MPIKSVTITITCGNDAMRNEHDVSAALREVADRIELFGAGHVPSVVRDANGNHVGTVDFVTE